MTESFNMPKRIRAPLEEPEQRLRCDFSAPHEEREKMVGERERVVKSLQLLQVRFTVEPEVQIHRFHHRRIFFCQTADDTKVHANGNIQLTSWTVTRSPENWGNKYDHSFSDLPSAAVDTSLWLKLAEEITQQPQITPTCPLVDRMTVSESQRETCEPLTLVHPNGRKTPLEWTWSWC